MRNRASLWTDGQLQETGLCRLKTGLSIASNVQATDPEQSAACTITGYSHSIVAGGLLEMS